jgi:hypothetical protein
MEWKNTKKKQRGGGASYNSEGRSILINTRRK